MVQTTSFWLYLKKFNLLSLFNFTRILFHTKGITNNHSVLQWHFPPSFFWKQLAPPQIVPHRVKKIHPTPSRWFFPFKLVLHWLPHSNSFFIGSPTISTRLVTPTHQVKNYDNYLTSSNM